MRAFWRWLTGQDFKRSLRASERAADQLDAAVREVTGK